MEKDLFPDIIVSANRALLGAVTQHLRGVTFNYDNSSISLRAYFDTGATDDDKELIDIVLTEILADFPQFITCNYEPIDLPFPEKMQVLTHWIFLRHEAF